MDFFMDRHNETEESLSRSSSRPLCDACMESNDPASVTEIPSAEMFCKDCCLKLCENCLKIHRKGKLTTSHKLEAVKNQSMVDENQTKLVPEVCQEHEGERLQIYCSCCKQVVCSFCYIESHQGHEWSDVEKAAVEFCNEIQNHIQNLAVRNKGLQDKKEELSQAKLNIIANMESLELKIHERKTLLKETIDKHANQLLMQAEAMRQEKLKLVKTEEEDIDVQLAIEERYSLDCQNITTQGSAGTTCRIGAQLSKRANELQKKNESICQRHLEPVNVVLKASNLDEFLKEDARSFVGKIEEWTLSAELPSNQVSTDDIEGLVKLFVPKIIELLSILLSVPNEETIECADKVLKLTVSALESWNPQETNKVLANYNDFIAASNASKRKVVLTKTQRITGMSVIENELFITTEKCSTVEVYNSLTFFCLRCWWLPGLTNPEDMVGSVHPKCLYIFDATGYGKIYLVSISGSTLTSWISGSTQVRLSVTPESNVVITYWGETKLKEYKPARQSSLIKQLTLRGRNSHAVKLKTGNFVVSRGNGLNGVFEVDASGREIKSFRGKKESESEWPFCPDKLVVDKNGSVIVADRGNWQIILLNSNLEFQRELLSSDNGLQEPITMVLDDATSRLFVADYDSDENLWRIFVINFAYL